MYSKGRNLRLVKPSSSLPAGNNEARQGEQQVGREREAAFRIRKAAKKLLFEAAEEYLREQGAEAMFKMKSQPEQVSAFKQ